MTTKITPEQYVAKTKRLRNLKLEQQALLLKVPYAEVYKAYIAAKDSGLIKVARLTKKRMAQSIDPVISLDMIQRIDEIDAKPAEKPARVARARKVKEPRGLAVTAVSPPSNGGGALRFMRWLAGASKNERITTKAVLRLLADVDTAMIAVLLAALAED